MAKMIDDENIRELKTFDPERELVPLVHGEWTTKFGEFPNFCSVCDRQAREQTDYCPHCGARMDGEHGKKN